MVQDVKKWFDDLGLSSYLGRAITWCTDADHASEVKRKSTGGCIALVESTSGVSRALLDAGCKTQPSVARSSGESETTVLHDVVLDLSDVERPTPLEKELPTFPTGGGSLAPFALKLDDAQKVLELYSGKIDDLADMTHLHCDVAQVVIVMAGSKLTSLPTSSMAFARGCLDRRTPVH